jgi:tetratricopeptide (TPR) repeat protein
MQANSLFWRLDPADGEKAIALLRRAVERYPDYAPAHSMLAFMLVLSGYAWNRMGSQLSQAAALAARAARLDDGEPWAHLASGFVAFMRRRTDEAAEEFQRALELNPNFAAAHGYLGWALAFDARSDQAIPYLEQAIRLSPHDPQNTIFHAGIAVAHYFAGRFADAVAAARKSLQQRSGFTSGRRIYIASLACSGQSEEAGAELARLKELQPGLSLAWIEEHVPYTAGPMGRFLDGMRKAGLD